MRWPESLLLNVICFNYVWSNWIEIIDLPVQKWSHCTECVGWAEYGQSGTGFYQPQTQSDGWAMKHHLTRARHKWMTDVGQIAGSLDPVVRDFLGSFANEPCHNDVARDCLQKWDRAEQIQIHTWHHTHIHRGHWRSVKVPGGGDGAMAQAAQVS